MQAVLWGAVCKATQYKILHHFFGQFWLNYVQYHILLQFMYIAAICVKLLQFMYIAAICVNCCNLRILQKNSKSAFNCHGDMLTKTVSVALSLFP